MRTEMPIGVLVRFTPGVDLLEEFTRVKEMNLTSCQLSVWDLSVYTDAYAKSLKAAVKKTATSVKKEISANAPKRTGRYAKSWTTKKTKENSHSLEMTVHSKDRYQLAHLLEKGHAKRNGGRVSGKPHIAPAEAHGEEMLTQLIEEALS